MKLRKIISQFLPLGIALATYWAAPNAVAADCADCHDKIAGAFKNSWHQKAWSSKEDMAKNNCSTCHGDGTEHMKSEGKTPMPILFKGKDADAHKASETCLKCHAKSTALAFWNAGVHAKNDVSCGSCHEPHGTALKPTAEVCFKCHKEIKNDLNKMSHHPIVEGKVTCFDCHNPHGTLNHGMLKTETVNQTCYKCHADKRGPFVWEHPPVEENCLNCHTSHGSRNSKLLTESMPNLCQNCHDWSRHPGTPNQGNQGFSAPAATFNYRIVGKSCMDCHSKIHGGFGPSNGSNGYNSGSKFVR